MLFSITVLKWTPIEARDVPLAPTCPLQLLGFRLATVDA